LEIKHPLQNSKSALLEVSRTVILGSEIEPNFMSFGLIEVIRTAHNSDQKNNQPGVEQSIIWFGFLC
jgi:hypothetical protein